MRKKANIINPVLKNQLKTAIQISNLSEKGIDEKCVTEKSFRVISELRAEFMYRSLWADNARYIPSKKKPVESEEVLRKLLTKIGYPIENGLPKEDPSEQILKNNLRSVSEYINSDSPVMCLSEKQAFDLIDVEARQVESIWMDSFFSFIPDGKDKRLLIRRRLDALLRGIVGRKFKINEDPESNLIGQEKESEKKHEDTSSQEDLKKEFRLR